jgi:hypothetical protein
LINERQDQEISLLYIFRKGKQFSIMTQFNFDKIFQIYILTTVLKNQNYKYQPK